MCKRLLMGLCICSLLVGCDKQVTQSNSKVNQNVEVEATAVVEEIDENNIYKAYEQYLSRIRNKPEFKSAGYGDLNNDGIDDLIVITRESDHTVKAEFLFSKNGEKQIASVEYECDKDEIFNLYMVYNEAGGACLVSDRVRYDEYGIFIDKTYEIIDENGGPIPYLMECIQTEDFREFIDLELSKEFEHTERAILDKEKQKYTYTVMLYDNYNDIDFTQQGRVIKDRAEQSLETKEVGFETYNIIVGQDKDLIINNLGSEYYIATDEEIKNWVLEYKPGMSAIQYRNNEHAYTIVFEDDISTNIYLEALTSKNTCSIPASHESVNSSDNNAKTTTNDKTVSSQNNDFRTLLGQGQIGGYPFKAGDSIQKALAIKELEGTEGYMGSEAYKFGEYAVLKDFNADKIVGMYLGFGSALYDAKIGDYFNDIVKNLDNEYVKYDVTENDEAPFKAVYYIYYEENNNHIYIYFDRYDCSLSATFIAKSVIE